MNRLWRRLLPLGLLALLTPEAAALQGDVLWSQLSNPTTSYDYAMGVATGTDGVYVVGYDYDAGTSYQWRVEKRSLATGAVIYSTRSFHSSRADYAYDVDVGGDGFYVVGSKSIQPSGCSTCRDWRVEKRALATGNMIWGASVVAGWDRADARAVELGSDGVYVGGAWERASGSRYDLMMEKRNLSTGAIIWSKTSDRGSGSADNVNDVAVGSDGVYFVGRSTGNDTAADYQWIIEKRALSDGSLIWHSSYNYLGTVGPIEEAYGAAIASDGLYVVGTDSSALTSLQWRIEKLSLTDGSRIWTQTSDPTGDHDYAYRVAVHSSGIYVIGNQGNSSSPQMRIERRRTSDGALLWARTYDTGNAAAGQTWRAVDVGDDGFYVVGHDSATTSGQWRMEKHELPCAGPVAASWTDATITAGATAVRAAHMTQLRTEIDARRADADLLACSWTDPVLTAEQTAARKVHVDEARTCVAEVYTQCGQGAPSFTDPTITAGTTAIRKVHVDELRSKTDLAP